MTVDVKEMTEVLSVGNNEALMPLSGILGRIDESRKGKTTAFCVWNKVAFESYPDWKAREKKKSSQFIGNKETNRCSKRHNAGSQAE